MDSSKQKIEYNQILQFSSSSLNINTMLQTKIAEQLKRIIKAKSVEIEVFAPENPKHGHYSTNAALKLAKVLKKNPFEIGEKIKKLLETKKFFERIEVVPPGFINFWISEEILETELKTIIKSEDDYGQSENLKGKKVMLEFTDPNPFKEFHIGHLYTNIVGESLARILEANGARVKRANYQGDVGMHAAKAIWGIKKKMASEKMNLTELAKRTLDYRIKFMGVGYALGDKGFTENEAIKLEIVDLNKKIFALDKDIKEIYQKGRKWSLDYFEKIYKRLGTKFDFYYFEREAGEVGFKIVKDGLKRGLFEESDGAIIFPGEKYGLHRRVFINSQGLPTYEAKELGLAPTKYKDFKYDLSLIITANEIIDYFKVLIMALKQIYPKLGARTRHIPHGMVRFASGKMSSRTGNVVKGEDLLEEVKKGVLKIIEKGERKISAKERGDVAEAVALAAIKYAFLKTSIGSDMVFDFKRALSLEGDSGPYIQYTYARLKSVLRKASGWPKKIDFMLLDTEPEKAVVRELIYFPDAVSRAAERLETNIITEYLYKLAGALNVFYETTPILKADRPLRENRLNLIRAATIVLKNSLRLLGIKAPERM
ncbi:arginine--tRNA ligase [Candidatus Wolfebacteria bacterium]|nr:arginine--tRNA ligase [Candidatus Wolfebacteria bacterium]